MIEIHVQRLVSVWVEDTYEVENTREETIQKAVNYEFDPISEETMWDSMVVQLKYFLKIIKQYYIMNKYIKTDIKNAEIYMKSALMNALHDVDSGEEAEINLGQNISWNLFCNCLIESGWKFDTINTRGWSLDFYTYWTSPSGINVIIEGSFFRGKEYRICKL